MTKAPHGKELEGPINGVLERCMEWILEHNPKGPNGRPLEESVMTVDQRARRAEFAWSDGKKARAEAQIIGFLIQEEGSAPGVSLWRWGWDDPSFDKNMVKHSLEMKKYGEKRKIDELTLPTTRVHKARCWSYAGLAAVLAGASGVAGCPVDDKLVLLTIGPVKS